MLKTSPSLRTFLCWIILIGLAPAGLFAQDEEEKPDTPAATEEEQADEEEKPDDEQKADEEKKDDEEKSEDEAKPDEEEKSEDEAKPDEEKSEDEAKPDEEKSEDEAKPDEEEKSEDEAESDEPTLEMTEMVLDLDNPSGLVIHPKTGHVFIASHDGVHRFNPNEKPLKCPLEISEYPTDVYGKGPKYNISALGLAFWDDEHLIVGDGSRPDGEELVRVYKIPEEHAGKYQKEDEAVYTAGPIPPESEESARGEGNYYGVAVVDGAVFVTNNGDDTKGWISKFTIEDDKATELTPFIATKEKTEVNAPVPIAVSPEGKLVVGQMGVVNVPGDSLLTIYDPETGELEKKWETGLSDIAGLAYSEKTKKWYCTDFAWAEPENGGLFELTIEDDKVTAKKLAKLDKPTALAFDKDGNLYVTVFGTGEDGDKMAPGKLLRIAVDQLQ